MTFAEIVARIQRGLKDPAILPTEIKAAVNKQLRSVTAAAHLPNLVKTDSVFVGAEDLSTNMPADFQHGLMEAYSATNKKALTIRPNSVSLYAGYIRTGTGTLIDEVALMGIEEDAILHVRPMSGAEDEIEVTYYRLPYDLVNDSDLPELPAKNDIHELCIVSGVVLEKLPDTDMDPEAITKLMGLYGSKLQSGMAILKAMYPNAPKPRPKLRRKTRFF